MIRSSLLIAALAVGLMTFLIAPASLAQSAAPNKPVSIPSPTPAQPAGPSATPAEPPPQQEQLPLGVAQPDASPVQHSGPSNAAPSVTSGTWIMQTLLALAVVIALIFLLRFLLRRLTGWGSSTNFRGQGLVEVLARSTVAPRTSVLFLRIHQRIVVAAQTPDSFATLAEFSDPDDVAAILTQVESSRSNSISRTFGAMIKQADRPYEADASAEEGGDDQEHLVDRARDGVSGLLSRMRSMKKRDGGNTP